MIWMRKPKYRKFQWELEKEKKARIKKKVDRGRELLGTNHFINDKHYASFKIKQYEDDNLNIG